MITEKEVKELKDKLSLEIEELRNKCRSLQSGQILEDCEYTLIRKTAQYNILITVLRGE